MQTRILLGYTTYDDRISDARDTEYRRNRVQIPIGHLHENKRGCVNNDGYVYEERDSEQERAERSNWSCESELKVFKHAGQLQFIKYRQEDIASEQASDDRREYDRGMLRTVKKDLRWCTQQCDSRDITETKNVQPVFSFARDLVTEFTGDVAFCPFFFFFFWQSTEIIASYPVPDSNAHSDGKAFHSFASQEILDRGVLFGEKAKVRSDQEAEEHHQTEKRIIDPSEDEAIQVVERLVERAAGRILHRFFFFFSVNLYNRFSRYEYRTESAIRLAVMII